MGRAHAILFTVSTYGTWLCGDARGWVEDGVVYPQEPALQARDRQQMTHAPYLFPRDQWIGIGQAIGDALCQRINLRAYALAVQSWHTHGLVGSTRHDIGDVIKCVKDAVRWHLNADRPIWAEGYDKRWCFEWPAVGTRLRYVQRHNLRNGWEPNPWPFLTTPPELMTWLAARPI